MTAPAFQIFEPVTEETPVLVEVPHAGLEVPAPFLSTMAAPLHNAGRDADLYVDELYADAPHEGATLLVAHVSRYVVDLNRAETDIDQDVVFGAPAGVRYNHGLIWRLTSEGERVHARPLTRAELEERLEVVYRPYHRALRAALDRKRDKFGIAILLAAHSMPSTGRNAQGEIGMRSDVVPGTRGRTSAGATFIDLVDGHARSNGWSVRHDDPYAGGFATQHYGRPAEGTHAVQVELARRLYLDEQSLKPRAGDFEATRGWCRALVRRLGALRAERVGT